jgi:hypothetical protein
VADLASRLLLPLFPRPFRARYGEEIAQSLAELWCDARGGPGRWRALAGAVAGIARAGLLERFATSLRPLRFRRLARRRPSSRGATAMDQPLRDLRHAARTLWRRPAFSVVAVLTLALGLFACVAIFSVVHAVLLR